MRERGRFRIGIILGIVLGVMVAFAAIPVFTESPSFLKGFLTCLVFVSGVLVVRMILVRKFMTGSQVSFDLKRYSRVLGILIISFGLAIVGLLGFAINDWMEEQKRVRQSQVHAISDLSESIQKTGLIYLMRNVLDQVDEDLRTLPDRKLSEETIMRIAALSYAFEPYVQISIDSTTNKKLSRERGQLLLALAGLSLDTATLKKITFNTSFAGADLENASLKGFNLSGVDLQGANLKNADLHGTNLEGANLSYSNLWGTKMRFSILKGADLRRANMKWSDLSHSNLQNANLNGVDLRFAQVQNAFLAGALIQWSYLVGTILKFSDLTKADFFGTTLEKAQLNGANFTDANFTQAYLVDANFTDSNITRADFSRAYVANKDWLELLNESNVTGADEINTEYKLSPSENIYRLEKIEKTY